jgi:hypothetical protein
MNWRNIVRMAAGVGGPTITIVWAGFTAIQARRPMSPLEWIGLVLISASIVYGIVELVIFMLSLQKEIKALKVWLGTASPQHETFRQWLRSHPPYSYEATATRSLDDRIVAMLEWWKSTQTGRHNA